MLPLFYELVRMILSLVKGDRGSIPPELLCALHTALALACFLIKLSSNNMHCNSIMLYDTGTLVLVFSAARREGSCVAMPPLPLAKSARFGLLNQIKFTVEDKHMSCANLFPTTNRHIRVLNLIMQISFKL